MNHLLRFRYMVTTLVVAVLVMTSGWAWASWNSFDETYKAVLPPKNEHGRVHKWDSRSLTYSFVTADNAKGYPDDHPEKISPVPEETKGYVREILEEMYASVIPVTFREVEDTNDPKRSANIRVMVYQGESGTYASAYMPKTYEDQRDGGVFLYDKGGDWKKGVGSAEYATLIHELGHAMGLKHPGRYTADETPPFLPLEMENTLNTVMSYNVDSNLAQQPSSWNWSLMSHDIAALQSLYGANTNFQAGDTVYKFYDDGKAYPYSGSDRQFSATQALWDGGGKNTLDMSALPEQEAGYRFDLKPGGQLTTKTAFNSGSYTLHAPATQNPEGSASQTFQVSKFGTVIGLGVKISDLQGSKSADEVIGNALDNHLYGNAGNDRLVSGAGRDILEGGDGDDWLIASAGETLLQGGAGDDVYLIEAQAAGTRIVDMQGRDRVAFADNATPDLQLQAGRLGMTRQQQDLVVDLNRDGKVNPAQDLVIAQFFDNGAIAAIGDWSSQQIAAAFSPLYALKP